MIKLTNIIIEDYAGRGRSNEPVSMGLPFPRGLIKDKNTIGLADPDFGMFPVQTEILSTWPDGSVKWVLLDFKASVAPGATKRLTLVQGGTDRPSHPHDSVTLQDCAGQLHINTGAASFYVNTRVFKPFDRVVVGGNDVLDNSGSRTVLTDDTGKEYEPLIESLVCETKGLVRVTIKVEGALKSADNHVFATFYSRLHFFADDSLIRMEFTIRNPKAASHPGGLWDLGDPGSVFFKDLSQHFSLSSTDEGLSIHYELNSERAAHSGDTSAPGFGVSCDHLPGESPIVERKLIVYQDSSGGENWMSKNHSNRNDEVRNSFKGYRVYSGKNLICEGERANPVASLTGKDVGVAAAIQYFWQNFPKALEVRDNTLIVRLFPEYYSDVFELQGGEQKTHETFLDFRPSAECVDRLRWVSLPLVPHALPEWYVQSGTFPYLTIENSDSNRELTGMIEDAVSGDNNLFRRREIIDEYGWRNFGDFYADHESATRNDGGAVISHYNNQYDCVYASLTQFVRTGDYRWFLLGDQLCRHARDIDIYHTESDRPEFNRGLFWHTDHYVEARTATHRCFSKRNVGERNLTSYGGGPSLSHNYSTGFLYHYYLTGSPCSADTVLDLSTFTENNIKMGMTLCVQTLKMLRKVKTFVRSDGNGEEASVQFDKVYDINGPGRASGNALNTLIDAFALSGKEEFIEGAENLIRWNIHPDDNIEKRNLLQTEDRWMYTIFLQSLCKYIEMKVDRGRVDSMFEYAKRSLLGYAEWMARNEYPYLEKPEKLEYPNETWAAQDIRKSIILGIAGRYGSNETRGLLYEKVDYFFDEAMKTFRSCKSATYIRPLVLLMNLGNVYTGLKDLSRKSVKAADKALELHRVASSGHTFVRKGHIVPKALYWLRNVSIKREFLAVKYRITR